MNFLLRFLSSFLGVTSGSRKKMPQSQWVHARKTHWNGEDTMMNFTLPSHYGNTDTQTFTPRQQLVGQGISVVGQGVQSFFDFKTAQAGGQAMPSQGGGYYQPTATPEQTNYTPLIITGLLVGVVAIGGIVYFNKGKK